MHRNHGSDCKRDEYEAVPPQERASQGRQEDETPANAQLDARASAAGNALASSRLPAFHDSPLMSPVGTVTGLFGKALPPLFCCHTAERSPARIKFSSGLSAFRSRNHQLRITQLLSAHVNLDTFWMRLTASLRAS
jgi:hypothetical protein